MQRVSVAGICSRRAKPQASSDVKRRVEARLLGARVEDGRFCRLWKHRRLENPGGPQSVDFFVGIAGSVLTSRALPGRISFATQVQSLVETFPFQFAVSHFSEAIKPDGYEPLPCVAL